MTQPTIATLSVQSLKKLMENSNAIVIDVREAYERAEMHIPGTLHLAKDSIVESIESVCPDKSQALYLHCRSGVRSLIAAQSLLNKGYQEVYSVEGGIMAWAEAGFPCNKLY